MGRACGDVWVTSYRPPSPPPTKGQRQPVNPTPDPAILDIFKFIFNSCLFCLQQRDKGTCEVLLTLQYYCLFFPGSLPPTKRKSLTFQTHSCNSHFYTLCELDAINKILLELGR